MLRNKQHQHLMSETPSKRWEESEDLYERSGVEDLARFYLERSDLNAFFEAKDRDFLFSLDIRSLRLNWVKDNIQHGSRVLDLGCGPGPLAPLRRRGVHVIGIDLVPECARTALFNGYDAALVARATSLPFADASFDYVVSLDFFGHIPAGEKDKVLREIKRVLRPSGVTLHGIECFHADSHKSYAEMDKEELKRFVRVDGHVGLEAPTEIKSRFEKIFSHVHMEHAFSICLAMEELIKHVDDYGVKKEADFFLDFLRSLSSKEKRIFNVVMGYVARKLNEHGIVQPSSGYVFLAASNANLCNYKRPTMDELKAVFCYKSLTLPARLEVYEKVFFDHGWYEPEWIPPVGRWLSDRGKIRFQAPKFSTLQFDVTTYMPNLDKLPLELSISLNGHLLERLSFNKAGWREVRIHVPPDPFFESDHLRCEMEFVASRTWNPRSYGCGSADDRDLSVAISNLELLESQDVQ